MNEIVLWNEFFEQGIGPQGLFVVNREEAVKEIRLDHARMLGAYVGVNFDEGWHQGVIGERNELVIGGLNFIVEFSRRISHEIFYATAPFNFDLER